MAPFAIQSIINGDENKFGENEEDLGKVINMIDAQLYGLF